VIDAVGPETLTFGDLVRLIARTIGRRVLFVHVPPTPGTSTIRRAYSLRLPAGRDGCRSPLP
jgi:uncharacterized protein YbjT (DUF2867 family)